jgi:hypothetical protein
MLERRISQLRLVSRIVSTILAFAVFIPLAMTVHKFLSTKNIFRLAPDPKNPDTLVRRTAWAKDSKAWPTYMYFVIATVSLVLNLSVLVAYRFSTKAQNIASKMNTLVSGLILLGNLTLWVVTVAIYRHEKDLDGKSNDLWGWTCSGPAKALQKTFEKEVQFDTYCNVQVSQSSLAKYHHCWRVSFLLTLSFKVFIILFGIIAGRCNGCYWSHLWSGWLEGVSQEKDRQT